MPKTEGCNGHQEVQPLFEQYVNWTISYRLLAKYEIAKWSYCLVCWTICSKSRDRVLYVIALFRLEQRSSIKLTEETRFPMNNQNGGRERKSYHIFGKLYTMFSFFLFSVIFFVSRRGSDGTWSVRRYVHILTTNLDYIYVYLTRPMDTQHTSYATIESGVRLHYTMEWGAHSKFNQIRAIIRIWLRMHEKFCRRMPTAATQGEVFEKLINHAHSVDIFTHASPTQRQTNSRRRSD